MPLVVPEEINVCFHQEAHRFSNTWRWQYITHKRLRISQRQLQSIGLTTALILDWKTYKQHVHTAKTKLSLCIHTV